MLVLLLFVSSEMTVILIHETPEGEEKELFIRCIAITVMENTNAQREKKKDENMVDEESDTIVLTYHKNHNVVTCVCGVVVQGEHLCDIKASTKIQIKECNYQSSYSGNKECCLICLKMEKKQEYENQWNEDEDGYSYCNFCGVKCDGELPKYCSCHAYVDLDGEKKCKSCHELWEELDMDEECTICESKWRKEPWL